MDINIDIEGTVVFYDIVDTDDESSAVDRILINQFGATVWWKKNGAMWVYTGTVMKDCLAVLRSTNSMGKMAWHIKRTAKKEIFASNTKETSDA